jgi:hypothetical protein
LLDEQLQQLSCSAGSCNALEQQQCLVKQAPVPVCTAFAQQSIVIQTLTESGSCRWWQMATDVLGLQQLSNALPVALYERLPSALC